MLDEAYFLPNSFYVDFPIEINVPHTQTIKVAVIYNKDISAAYLAVYPV